MALSSGRDGSRRLGIRRTTLADEAHEGIRAAIVGNEVAPGDRLNIDALSEQLGVSATPVREALARLAAEGLASYEPLVGYRVEPPLDAQAFDRLMEARVLLEPRVAKLAAERRTEADLETFDNQPLTPEDDGRGEYLTSDAAFHAWVAACARNPFLSSALADLGAHLHIYRLGQPAGRANPMHAEHHAIHEAIAARDGGAASAAMAAHLERSYRRHEAGLSAG